MVLLFILLQEGPLLFLIKLFSVGSAISSVAQCYYVVVRSWGSRLLVIGKSVVQTEKQIARGQEESCLESKTEVFRHNGLNKNVEVLYLLKHNNTIGEKNKSGLDARRKMRKARCIVFA